MLQTSLSVKNRSELKVVQCTQWVEEERITTPAGEKAVIAASVTRASDPKRPAPLRRCLPAVRQSRRLGALTRVALRSAPPGETREASRYAISQQHRVGVNLELVQRVSREGLQAGLSRDGGLTTDARFMIRIDCQRYPD